MDKGYDEKYGARPLKRAIQKYLEDPFAEEIINSDVSEVDLLRADCAKDAKELTIEVIKGGLLEMTAGAEEALKPEKATAKKSTPKKAKGKKKSDDASAKPTSEESEG